MSRWQPTEVQMLVRETPRARSAAHVCCLFPRHSEDGVRRKAYRLGLPWPRARRAGKKS
ncbi:hypothetical protein [Burkholderia glumae]|uniref:hypothetical protein n=1 Tax=Burkholderia glumae TaxID=337 RepID=UPI0002D459EA|nr:hypothetical protein [Burkholderia glumae]